MGQADPPRIAWSSCGDGFQCAYVPVPLDYDRPTDGTITVAPLRLPAADPAKRKGLLFINPGGPGGSGVGSVRSTGKGHPQEVRDAYDLVGFDPRGVRGSTPLRCFDDEEDALAAQHRQKFPVTAADIAEWQKVDRVFADACAAHGRPILEHMSTANVARDLDLLRRALGDPRLNYLGYSCGSYIGMTYATISPPASGRSSSTGCSTPSNGRPATGRRLAPSRSRPASTAPRAVRTPWTSPTRSATRPATAARCPATRGPATRRCWNGRRSNPIPYPGLPDYLMSYDAIIGATLSGLYTPRWSGTADFLAQLEAEPQASAAAGTPSVAAPVTAGRSPAFGDYPQFEAFAAVPCSETDNPTAFSAWGRAADKAAVRYPHFGRYWTWDSSVCDVWPARDADRYTGPWRRRRRTRSWSRATTTTPPLPMRVPSPRPGCSRTRA